MSPAAKPDPVPPRQTAEYIMEQLAQATHERNRMLSEMELEITDIRIKYEPQLSSLNSEIAAYEGAFKLWAKANRAEFGDAQSLDLVHGSLEFRLGNPSLALIGKNSWEDILLNLTLLNMTSYIRQILEPDKAKLLADRGDLGEKLESIGCKVKQTEKLSIIVKTEGLS